DLYNKNILVTKDSFFIIDVDDSIKVLPYFYDLLSLPFTEASEKRTLLLKALNTPEIQSKWDELLYPHTWNEFAPTLILCFFIIFITFGTGSRTISPNLIKQTWEPIASTYFPVLKKS